MYHDIYKRPRSSRYDHFYVLENVFTQQLDALINAGYTPVSLSGATDSIQSAKTMPEKSFAVTFDDGYSSFASIAAPILQKRNIPATVFIVSELVGTKNSWVESEGYQSDLLMSWDEIEALDKSTHLFEFQSHTANHVRLADISLEQASDELTRSKATIEDRLGKSVNMICYPWGSVNNSVAELARNAGYQVGLTTQFGRIRQTENSMLLPRIAMHHVPVLSLKFGPRWPNFWWRIRTRKDNRC